MTLIKGYLLNSAASMVSFVFKSSPWMYMSVLQSNIHYNIKRNNTTCFNNYYLNFNFILPKVNLADTSQEHWQFKINNMKETQHCTVYMKLRLTRTNELVNHVCFKPVVVGLMPCLPGSGVLAGFHKHTFHSKTQRTPSFTRTVTNVDIHVLVDCSLLVARIMDLNLVHHNTVTSHIRQLSVDRHDVIF